MSQMDVANTSTTNMTSTLENYSVAARTPEGATGADETEYTNTFGTKYFGYYKKIPELKKAIDALSTWTVGKGYDTDPDTQAILEHIRGWGEDTFESIMWNMTVNKKVFGDAFAEIIKDKNDQLLNIKVLDPTTIKTVANKQGLIKKYVQINKIPNKAAVEITFQPKDILHLVNDRVADEIHGTSVVESVEWVILAKNEAMADMRKLMHRNVVPRVVWKVDTDDTGKMSTFQQKVDDAVKFAENLVIPKDAAEFEILAVPPNSTLNPMPWIEYLDNFFYSSVGVPKIILGGSQEFTEASSKIAYLTFEQVYAKEQRELEADLWNQIFVRIKYRKPASLQNELLSSEEKNTGQVGFQPNDVTAGSGQA